MVNVRARDVSCVDLFCGVGGLTHGFIMEGLRVNAGIDIDPACRYPYSVNNHTKFILKDLGLMSVHEVARLFTPGTIRVLAGCAPCQPFSTYSQRYRKRRRDRKWALLNEFARMVKGIRPDIVTMENVPAIRRHDVFHDFVGCLSRLDYYVWHEVVDCAEYGVPQSRKRLVLLASQHAPITLIEPLYEKGNFKTVRQAIGELPPLMAGECDPNDHLHVSAKLSDINLARIRASRPGGTWRDWPSELVARCHKTNSGRSFPSVYGRMEWDKPAPTITTQCYGFGNGRFGHPEQDRAISLREAAILQGFPYDYEFLPPGSKVVFNTVGRLIGNAVPVHLGRAIARSILRHIDQYDIESNASTTYWHRRMSLLDDAYGMDAIW